MTAQAAGTMFNEGRLKEVKQRLLFLVIAIVVFRLGAHLTIPGINPAALAEMFNQQPKGIIDMFDMFGGGALKRLSIFALGIMPYISASIIIQLMTKVVPSLEQLSKEGQSGKHKITQYTRYLTVVLGLFQAVFITKGLYNPELVHIGQLQFVFIGTITLVTGTMFLMWLGEQITERGVGNGISMIIFAGIVAGLPGAVGSVLRKAADGDMSVIVVFMLIAIAIGVVAFVVFVERGQRRIVVNYAKRQQGRKMYAAQSTHLPLKLNMAGVIPAIFASAIVLFPTTIASFVSNTEGLQWLGDFAQKIAPGQPLYILFYSAGIIFFCFFYTAMMFNSKETADNLKKSGAFVPGIRPGENTAKYIDSILTRLTFVGAIYITLVCLLPEFLRMGLDVQFYFGGTSLLIIVVVVMDFMAQVQAHLMSHQYDSLLDKANLKSKGKS